MQPSHDNASLLMEVRGLVERRFTIDALRGVSLEIQRGATLAVVGESGSGKSTLANCMAGIEACDSGQIWFDGRDLSAVPMRRRMAELGRHRRASNAGVSGTQARSRRASPALITR